MASSGVRRPTRTSATTNSHSVRHSPYAQNDRRSSRRIAGLGPTTTDKKASTSFGGGGDGTAGDDGSRKRGRTSVGRDEDDELRFLKEGGHIPRSKNGGKALGSSTTKSSWTRGIVKTLSLGLLGRGGGEQQQHQHETDFSVMDEDDHGDGAHDQDTMTIGVPNGNGLATNGVSGGSKTILPAPLPLASTSDPHKVFGRPSPNGDIMGTTPRSSSPGVNGNLDSSTSRRKTLRSTLQLPAPPGGLDLHTYSRSPSPGVGGTGARNGGSSLHQHRSSLLNPDHQRRSMSPNAFHGGLSFQPSSSSTLVSSSTGDGGGNLNLISDHYSLWDKGKNNPFRSRSPLAAADPDAHASYAQGHQQQALNNKRAFRGGSILSHDLNSTSFPSSFSNSNHHHHPPHRQSPLSFSTSHACNHHQSNNNSQHPRDRWGSTSPTLLSPTFSAIDSTMMMGVDGSASKTEDLMRDRERERKKQMVWDPEMGFMSRGDREKLEKERNAPKAQPRNEAERILQTLEGLRTPVETARRAGSRSVSPSRPLIPTSHSSRKTTPSLLTGSTASHILHNRSRSGTPISPYARRRQRELESGFGSGRLGSVSLMGSSGAGFESGGVGGLESRMRARAAEAELAREGQRRRQREELAKQRDDQETETEMDTDEDLSVTEVDDTDPTLWGNGAGGGTNGALMKESERKRKHQKEQEKKAIEEKKKEKELGRKRKKAKRAEKEKEEMKEAKREQKGRINEVGMDVSMEDGGANSSARSIATASSKALNAKKDQQTMPPPPPPVASASLLRSALKSRTAAAPYSRTPLSASTSGRQGKTYLVNGLRSSTKRPGGFVISANDEDLPEVEEEELGKIQLPKISQGFAFTPTPQQQQQQKAKETTVAQDKEPEASSAKETTSSNALVPVSHSSTAIQRKSASPLPVGDFVPLATTPEAPVTSTPASSLFGGLSSTSPAQESTTPAKPPSYLASDGSTTPQSSPSKSMPKFFGQELAKADATPKSVVPTFGLIAPTPDRQEKVKEVVDNKNETQPKVNLFGGPVDKSAFGGGEKDKNPNGLNGITTNPSTSASSSKLGFSFATTRDAAPSTSSPFSPGKASTSTTESASLTQSKPPFSFTIASKEQSNVLQPSLNRPDGDNAMMDDTPTAAHASGSETSKPFGGFGSQPAITSSSSFSFASASNAPSSATPAKSGFPGFENPQAENKPAFSLPGVSSTAEKSVFGGSGNPGVSLFSASTPSSTPFGSSNASTFAFGQSKPVESQPTSKPFGAATSSSTPPFSFASNGGTSSSPFGATTASSAAPASPSFAFNVPSASSPSVQGSNTPGSPFAFGASSQNQNGSSSGPFKFGSGPAPTAANPQPQTSTSVFGASSPQNPPFAVSSPQTPSFGAPSPQNQGFGAPSPHFGNVAPTPPPFGAPSPQAPSPTPSFGAPGASSPFGPAATTSPFGATNGFGGSPVASPAGSSPGTAGSPGFNIGAGDASQPNPKAGRKIASLRRTRRA